MNKKNLFAILFLSIIGGIVYYIGGPDVREVIVVGSSLILLSTSARFLLNTNGSEKSELLVKIR